MPEFRSIGLALLLWASVPFGAVAAEPLKWETSSNQRSAPLAVPENGRAGFALLTPESTGIHFTNVLSEVSRMENANLMNGSGVALVDYDGDGWCDIYLCSLTGPNRLYRNLGNWRFEDVAAFAGVVCADQQSTGAVFADINGDRRPDLIVTALGGPNACFLNDGQGRFTDITETSGISSRLGATTAALADVDGNGTMDLYIANYGATSILRSGGALNVTTLPDGRIVVRGRYARRIKIVDGTMHELGEPDTLYLNDGNGRFKPLSWTGGNFLDENGKPLTSAPWDQGLTAMFRDINRDGRPDLYVCNDGITPDRCWINEGNLRFRALSALALRQTCYFSMGVDFADLDRDGHDDFLVVDMLSRERKLRMTQTGLMQSQPKLPGDLETRLQIRRNVLFHARGDGTFAEIAEFADLAASEWSWSCVFLDIDLDGWEDLLVTNGFAHNVDDLDTRERVQAMGQLGAEASRKTYLLYPPLETPNLAFRNQRNLTFSESSDHWGFNSLQISTGMALGDLDNDGDLDAVVNCINGPALVYRNESSAPRVAVRLRGNPPNTEAIGARITVLGGPVPQTQEMIAGGRYVSSDDPMRVFAAGSSTNLAIEIVWPNGTRTHVRDARPNRIYEIAEPSAGERQTVQFEASSPNGATWFEDASSLLNHTHTEMAFDDFSRQPLLPHRLSQFGPAAAWFDLNQDGRDDLIIGSGAGGALAAYRNDAKTGFVPLPPPDAARNLPRDTASVLGWTPGANGTELLVASANYEDGRTNSTAVLRFKWRNGEFSPVPGIPDWQASAGALCAGDIDGDGDLDLFVGGRVAPGRYPQPVSSFIYRNENGVLNLDGENSRALHELGLVSGALFSDLTADGYPELILACEWGPIRIFRNKNGQFRPWLVPVKGGERTQGGAARVNPSSTLDDRTGWWNGLATGDFDGDGRMDIVASNWGLNTMYDASAERPIRLFFGDLGGIGGADLIEAYDDPEFGTVPRRDLLAISAVMPSVREHFPTHAQFATATVSQVLGNRAAAELRATTLASMVFLNRGDHFESSELPREAQWAPAFGLNIADFDADGHEDLFLAQNFSATRETIGRYDAGRGLLLRGDGKGGLVPMDGRNSGILVYGDQRGSAIADYDSDGRTDLLVTQNGGRTKLYRNTTANRGLRVRLSGPPANPSGVGAQVRLETSDWKGPVREVRAGSGFWSQDSATQVLAASGRKAVTVWVRWPGGSVTTTTVPDEAEEVIINSAGGAGR